MESEGERERERENIISRILIRNTSDEFENLNWFNRVKRGCSIPLVKRGEKRASVEQRARIFLGMLKGEEAQPRYSTREKKIKRKVLTKHGEPLLSHSSWCQVYLVSTRPPLR